MSESYLILMEFSGILHRKKMVEVMRSEGAGGRVKECEKEVCCVERK